MALIAEVVNFVCDPSNGDQDVPLTQFGAEAPKCVLAISGGRNALGPGNDTHSFHSIGFATSALDEYSICAGISQNAAAENSQRRSNDSLLQWTRPNEAPRRTLNLTALEVNNLALSLSGNTSVSPWCTALALGGSDLTNVACVQWPLPGSPGLQDVEGFGFQPNAAITITALQTSWASGSVGVNVILSIWSGSETRCIEMLSRHDENPIIPYQSTFNNALRMNSNLDPSIILKSADFVQWLPDGFQLNWTNTDNNTVWQAATIAFECDTEIGIELSPNQATPPNRPVDTTTTHTPRAVFFMSPSRGWLDADTDGNSQSLGLTDGTTSGSASLANRTGVAGNTTGRCQTSHRDDQIHEFTDYADASTDELASGALLANAIRSDFSLADATQREWAYLSFGDGGGPGPTPSPPAWRSRKIHNGRTSSSYIRR